ncbi:Tm-1-like ATP-binding domain-containing protein [Gemmobacter denitrificans]|uniref:Tm-1-like ATP-binding domain-containing protein n=1 Tax=Gemmobacter denitrificans TaxID=3123040 RepID=A0ABU8C0E6_9RHOB
MTKTILVIGTFDTKADELAYLIARIESQGGAVLAMDVSVLGQAAIPVGITKHEVAAAAGTTINALIALGEEGEAFAQMSAGAATLTRRLHQAGRVDGMIALGGTMGTDLALDCAQALPLGVPKYIVSTVAGSPLIAAERMAADVQFILWAGGLYGLNPLCKSSLSQAAGAVLGAARAAEPPRFDRPLIGMTSLGSSCLKYMKRLHPELTRRGYDIAVFHTTGMGGMAFERLAADGAFACVMDFSLQELVNMLNGSLVSAGADRLTGAGRSGTPQLVAPGAADILDLAGWQDIPERFRDRPFHMHNRLIKSVAFNADERRDLARAMADRLAAAQGPTHFFLPKGGIEEWDRPGEAARDPEGLAAFCEAAESAMAGRIGLTVLDAHINDAAFCTAVLARLDDWIAAGIVPKGRPENEDQKTALGTAADS